MLQSIAVTASELRVGDVFFLNDLKSFEDRGTFYVECYEATTEGAQLTNKLQFAQILEVARGCETTKIEALSSDNRKIELEFSHFDLISRMNPEKVEVSNLQAGDTVVLRDRNNPGKLKNDSFKYALIARRYGLLSRVLKIKKSWRGDYRVTFLFCGVEKITVSVDSGSFFEIFKITP